jgi:hypothetical protein
MLVASRTFLYAIEELSDCFHLFSGSVETGVASIPANSPTGAAAVFRLLWHAGLKEPALLVLKQRPSPVFCGHVLALITFLKLPKQIDSPLGEKTDAPAVTEALSVVLTAIRSELGDNILIDTVLFQLYAFIGDIVKLADLISNKPTLNEGLLYAFFESRRTPSYVMFLRYVGKQNEATEAFQSLSSLDEMCALMNLHAEDWSFIKENIIWMASKSPKHALKILCGEKVSVHSSIKFCKTKLISLYPAVVRAALFRKDVLSRADLLREYIQTMLNLLAHIRDDNFDFSLVGFCDYILEGNACDIGVIETELGEKLIEVLRRFRDVIDMKLVLSRAERVNLQNVKVEIYGYCGEIEKALDLLWPNLNACESFCRQIPLAFDELFRKIKDKMAVGEQTAAILSLIARNIEVIENIDSALSSIDSSASLEAVGDLLEDCYRKLISRRRDAEIEAALAFSDQQEKELERVQLESQCMVLRTNSKCYKCGKEVNFRFVERTPEGYIGHLQCPT